jgi:nitrite reductase/ring-hydroxylating ferredoxin subunit
MTDWKDIGGEARRIGLVHGALNTTAAALYATALVLRRKPESRPLGLALSLAGYSTVIASAILGGDMVYRHRIGTNHANDEALPEQFVPVLPAEELNEGELRRVEANGTPVMLARHEGEVYALAERCAHLGGPLAEGKLIDGSVQCPWHGSRFQLRDGNVLDGPSAFPQPCLAVRIRNGQIEVQAAERQALQDTVHAVGEKGSDLARELGG